MKQKTEDEQTEELCRLKRTFKEKHNIKLPVDFHNVHQEKK